MICATMLTRQDKLCGFTVSGHAGMAAHGSDIVCAAVSSAVYMAANTLTDVCGCAADIAEQDGHLSVRLTQPIGDSAQTILKGLQDHLQGLSAQYPNFITIQLTEV